MPSTTRGSNRLVSVCHEMPPKHRRCVLCGEPLVFRVSGYHIEASDGSPWDLFFHADCLKQKRGNRDVRKTITRYQLLTMIGKKETGSGGQVGNDDREKLKGQV